MEKLVPLLEKQTAIILANIETTLDAVEEGRMDADGSRNWPIRDQFFHLLHSMDQWFINPYDYRDTFSVGTASLAVNAEERRISKKQLREYFAAVKGRIVGYLRSLDDSSLAGAPAGCPFTRIELILGQFRHAMYHVGLIHGCLRSETGHSPDYLGLSSPVPPRV
jgi:uncharacterized damage-inducible protein DinB